MKHSGAIVLLLAGGQGIRIQSTRPKQFIEIEGESVLLHTMQAFERHPLVGDIRVVCSPEWDSYVQRQATMGHIGKFRQCIPSGPTSHVSFINGIRAMEADHVPQDATIIVHEAVRPFISHEIISNNILTCQTLGNAVTATYSHESYLETADGKTTQGYIPRNRLMRAQTPLTFRMADLTAIIRLAQERGIEQAQSLFTLANEVGWQPLHIVEGTAMNFKITLPQDIEIYRKLRNLNCD